MLYTLPNNFIEFRQKRERDRDRDRSGCRVPCIAVESFLTSRELFVPSFFVCLFVCFCFLCLVAVLKGQLFECVEDYEKADEIYAQVLEENEAHQGAMKRRACIAKAQGDDKKAIGVLKKYLDVFVTDAEAWEELGSLYVTNQMMKQASFCYEELILIQPQNPRYVYIYVHLLYCFSRCLLFQICFYQVRM